MSTIEISYNLTDAGSKQEFLATGTTPRSKKTFLQDLADATPDERQLVLDLTSENPMGVYSGITLRDYTAAPRNGNLSELDYYPMLQFDAPLTDWAQVVTELRAILPGYLAAVERKRLERIERDTRDAQEKIERDRRNAELRAHEAAEAAREEACKAAFTAEKLRWAAAHGSDRLKRGLARDHECTGIYIIERAALEAPGYTVDVKQRAAWKNRPCPSLEALDTADKLEKSGLGTSEIVWLTESPDEDDYNFEECEAVVINDYLGKYTLIGQI